MVIKARFSATAYTFPYMQQYEKLQILEIDRE
jgi:hypothetical protein